MALDYFAPGVYVEEVDRGSRPIEGISMSVAGFVGFTEDVRGEAELFRPMMVTNWGQYLEYFGKQGSDGFTNFNAYLPFAIKGWFENGGGRCWVTSIGTRLPSADPQPPEQTGKRLLTAGKRPSLQFSLKSVETDGQPEQNFSERVNVSIITDAPRPLENSESNPRLDTGEFFRLKISQNGQNLEEYRHLTMNPNVETEVGDYVVTALENSEWVSVVDVSERGHPLSRRPADGEYEVIPPPIVSLPENLWGDMQGRRDDRTGVQGLFEIDDVAMVACPDLMRVYEDGLMNLDQIHGIMEAMISGCENSHPSPAYRMAVLDTPPRLKPQQVAAWLQEEFGVRSKFAALYYPWIKVPNPRNNGKPILVPPCGHAMGVWCRTDEKRGIYKAPANETPRGVLGLAYDVNFREQEYLNPKGINCIRKFPNRGIRIWGARTLVELDDIQWRYISVRRLISYIERSIELGTQWVVFEPNDEDLWLRVRSNVSNFLERIWFEGGLAGASPSQAFYVKCDAEINTPETMLLGRLYVEVGLSPVRPAEFVIFRVSQWVASEGE